MQRRKSTTKRSKLMLALGVLIAMALVAAVLGSRASVARGASKDVESAPLPNTLAPKDTTPPANVKNLRRTDTVDAKAVAAACETRSTEPSHAK